MRRLVPLVAVLFALAAGIALGAGPLDDRPGSAASRDATRGRPTTRYEDAFVAAAASRLYAGRLAARPVTILTTPGVPAATVAALTEQVTAAGGTVAATARLTQALVAPGQKTLVDTMGSQLVTQLRTQVPALADPALTTYPRMGRLLGVAVGATATALPPAAVSTVRESLRAARLTTDLGQGPVTPLALVLLGHDLDDAIVSGLVQGLAAQVHGVVVAGAAGNDDVAAIAAAKTPVATVDGTDTAAGRAATVLALIRQVTGGGGSFGASGIDGPIPVG